MKLIRSLTIFEKSLWLFSVAVIAGSALIFGSTDIITLIASIIGVTALIFVARGHYIGQIMIIVFSCLYGAISVCQHYYGEAITYLGMTAPIALVTTISWIRHPYRDSEQVEVSSVSKKKAVLLCICTVIVTAVFYFILKQLGNAQLLVSTVSIATSFFAAALLFFRSPYYAVAYAANDIVLIVLWVMASMVSISNIPMVACFSMFFLNDMYGFYSWRKMKKEQAH